ncbi:hypothetical protein Syun_025696 [Stephania yunnanensis]|uniref:Uncharacterized protein n=1 Tax=Stephania yunnanensis TaxID=152371 RepID=A0AAP0ESW8_9MAGN
MAKRKSEVAADDSSSEGAAYDTKDADCADYAKARKVARTVSPASLESGQARGSGEDGRISSMGSSRAFRVENSIKGYG